MATDSSETIEQSVRDRLAIERTLMANERTLLAYVRTAIMIVVTGATLLKFYGELPLPAASGWALIIAGIGVAIFGASRFRKLASSLL